ncbi:MAG: DUF2892 domain-containing protein [Croceitalea sp.]|nr:DUF2892 domain-containing protein [Croceitalea sp.]MBT8237141.1 DUF2892 domain-containing protein [Croceitalea sp.]NNC33250.1 DUF2892 domain-containing protein [Croceitalea sp.]NNM18928.1 DUF2892 domain-containing protein [Croceitalea sp.]
MKKNMGNTDRILRTLLAVVIGILFFNNSIEGILAYALMAFAVIFLLTSFVSFCPLYTIFGWSTCKVKE